MSYTHGPQEGYRDIDAELRHSWRTKSSPLSLHYIGLTLFMLCAWTATSVAQPSGVVVPLSGSKGLSSEASVSEMVRAALKGTITVIDAAQSTAAVKAAGCAGEKCRSVAAKVANSAKARFVVIPVINNEFDIYAIKISVADLDFIGESMVEVEGSCEFCDDAGLAAKLKELVGDAKLTRAFTRSGKPKAPTSFVLSVVTSPEGAEVFIDGKSRGKSPLSIPGLGAQPYELEVKKKGFLSQKKKVTPPNPLPKDPISESFTLKPEPPSVFPVEIRTQPKGATVTLDGVKIKVKTPFKAKVRPGKHEIVINLKGYQEFKKVFETPKQAETISVIAKLSKIPPKKPVVTPKPKPEPVKATPKPAPALASSAMLPPPKPPLLGGSASGILIGAGLVSTVAGGWLLSLHGDVACSNGETRLTCPDIYETKYPAGLLLGVGTAAIGAGIISLIIDSDWPENGAPNATIGASSGVKTSFVPSVTPTAGGASASVSLTF